ncbi:MAG: 2-phospho-L-lactate transferase [Chloroflexi bacterium]|nr:2-phospho-L-lactate transferase [Chloroflexota bacterium]MCC6896406.1 2-phospho-L-lactate transferase [Anaerolineae bacterium]
MAMKVVVLVGGVGGAKLALGLAKVLPPEDLTVIVNTGDDTWMYGLRICPDLDTIMYTLSDLVNKENGWGIAGDTFQTISAMKRYGEDAWFGLGDQDMATHILRTRWLQAGSTLTEVTNHLTKKLGIHQQILPMTNASVATIVDTQEHGEIDFQTYFVRYRWQPTVKSLRLDGLDKAEVSPEVEAALNQADALIVGPSNPWLSIDPILSVPGMRDLIGSLKIPKVAISPIVGGEAIKGPAAKLMVELGHESSAEAVARYYGDLIDGFVYDASDDEMNAPQQYVTKFETIMKTDEIKVSLARNVLEWIQSW